MNETYRSCPWPKNSVGIPYMYGGTPWEEEFQPDANITETITKMAVSRLLGPLDAVYGDVRSELHSRCRHLVTPADYEILGDLIRLLDLFYWPHIETVIRICVAVAPNVSLAGGTLEGMLKDAFAKGGISTVDEADALIRDTFFDLTNKKIRKFWPEFDPEQMTIMRPHDDCVESAVDPIWPL